MTEEDLRQGERRTAAGEDHSLDVPDLIREVRHLRAALQEALSFTDHDDARCEYFGKCQCGLEDLRARCKALDLGE